jgi:hypothetical protein
LRHVLSVRVQARRELRRGIGLSVQKKLYGMRTPRDQLPGDVGCKEI